MGDMGEIRLKGGKGLNIRDRMVWILKVEQRSCEEKGVCSDGAVNEWKQPLGTHLNRELTLPSNILYSVPSVQISEEVKI